MIYIWTTFKEDTKTYFLILTLLCILILVPSTSKLLKTTLGNILHIICMCYFHAWLSIHLWLLFWTFYFLIFIYFLQSVSSPPPHPRPPPVSPYLTYICFFLKHFPSRSFFNFHYDVKMVPGEEWGLCGWLTWVHWLWASYPSFKEIYKITV